MHYSKQYIMINKEPNLYKLKDNDGKIWTLPVHSVERI